MNLLAEVSISGSCRPILLILTFGCTYILSGEGKPSSFLPLLHPPVELEEKEGGVLYLEKRNSNATYFQVLSSISPAELKKEGTKSFYYYDEDEGQGNVSSTVEHQVQFSHQQKTEPIEVPEMLKATAITGSGSSTTIAPSATAAAKAPLIENVTSTVNSVVESGKDISESPLAFNEPNAEVNTTLKTLSQEAHLEVEGKVEGGTDDPLIARGDEERFLGSDWKGLSDEDKKIRRIWGGSCKLDDWKKCSHIESYGGDYFVKDKRNPEKMILKHHEIKCFVGEERNRYYCLRNGWTVSRCHLLCMSLCNNSYRNEYDKVVSHEGACRLQFGR